MRAWRTALRALVAALGPLGAETALFELAFYHHYPNANIVCFVFGQGDLGSSAGPLQYGDVKYRSVELEPGVELSVDVVSAASVSACGNGLGSRIGGARRTPLVASASNTFGYTSQGLESNRAVQPNGNTRAVDWLEVNLMLWNGAAGVGSCNVEVEVNNQTRWNVGPIQAGAGLEISTSCDELQRTVTGFVFRCGGQVYEYGGAEVAPLFCMGASQQVSLIGQAGGQGAWGPAVALVSGTQRCSCTRSCAPSCFTAASSPRAAGGLAALCALWAAAAGAAAAP